MLHELSGFDTVRGLWLEVKMLVVNGEW